MATTRQAQAGCNFPYGAIYINETATRQAVVHTSLYANETVSTTTTQKPQMLLASVV